MPFVKWWQGKSVVRICAAWWKVEFILKLDSLKLMCARTTSFMKTRD